VLYNIFSAPLILSVFLILLGASRNDILELPLGWKSILFIRVQNPQNGEGPAGLCAMRYFIEELQSAFQRA
jgi:hypothetical protein